jgi:hypothetical protein
VERFGFRYRRPARPNGHNFCIFAPIGRRGRAAFEGEILRRALMKTVWLVGVCTAALGVSPQLSAQAPKAGPQPPPQSGKWPLPPPPEAARVLNLSMPIVIDEPGYYRLDRDWEVENDFGIYLEIRANGVTLDFRGYSFFNRGEGIAVAIFGDSVRLRNGGINSPDDQATPLSVQSSAVLIENMSVFGQNASYFGGDNRSRLVMRDSSIASGASGVPPGSILERNRFGCAAPGCELTIADDTRVTDNVWNVGPSGPALIVQGAGNLIERNVFSPSDDTSIVVNGRQNLVRDNTIQVDGLSEAAIQVNNGANVLEANIVLPVPGGDRATVGIQFTADGNSFGNNRLGALVPVHAGSTTQTNWGGNVGL